MGIAQTCHAHRHEFCILQENKQPAAQKNVIENNYKPKKKIISISNAHKNKYKYASMYYTILYLCNVYIGTSTPTQSHLHFDGCFPVYGCMLDGCSDGGEGCLMLASSHKANILHFNKRHQQQQYRSIENPTLKIYFNISFNQ